MANRQERLRTVVFAMTNLYGVVPKPLAAEFFNRMFPDEKPTTREEMGRVTPAGLGFGSRNGSFVSEPLLYDRNFLDDVLAAQEGKTYYEPDGRTLLRYLDDLYFEHTPTAVRFLRHLQDDVGLDAGTAERIAEDMSLTLRTQSQLVMGRILYEFERRSIVFKNEDQIRRLLPFLMDFINDCRCWMNRGHSPRELSGTLDRPVRSAAAQKPTASRPGRNDPCPCGSGKKYKNCHGGPRLF